MHHWHKSFAFLAVPHMTNHQCSSPLATAAQPRSIAFPAAPCRRVHDRSITHLAYLPDHGTVLALSWDATLRAFDVATSHCRYTATNDNGCPFTGMVHDVLHMQVGWVSCLGARCGA